MTSERRQRLVKYLEKDIDSAKLFGQSRPEQDTPIEDTCDCVKTHAQAIRLYARCDCNMFCTRMHLPSAGRCIQQLWLSIFSTQSIQRRWEFPGNSGRDGVNSGNVANSEPSYGSWRDVYKYPRGVAAALILRSGRLVSDFIYVLFYLTGVDFGSCRNMLIDGISYLSISSTRHIIFIDSEPHRLPFSCCLAILWPPFSTGAQLL